MQIMIKLPNGTTKVAQNDSEQPILPNSQLFQSFPTEVAQNDLEQPISPNSQLFQSFPTKWSILGRGVNDQMQIVNTKLPNENIQTYQPQMIDSGGGGQVNDQMQIVNTKTTKWKYPNLPTTNDQFQGRGVNDQMQILNTKLPNENIQTYQPQMINSGEGGG